MLIIFSTSLKRPKNVQRLRECITRIKVACYSVNWPFSDCSQAVASLPPGVFVSCAFDKTEIIPNMRGEIPEFSRLVEWKMKLGVSNSKSCFENF